MLKPRNLGKNLIVPAFTLCTLFLAAGSVVTVATTGTSASTESALSSVPQVSRNNDSELKQFCAMYWGELSQDGGHCRFEQTIHINIAAAGRTPVLTQIPIVEADTVSIFAQTPPEPSVGGRGYGSQQFVSETAGYLAFRPAYGASFFSVQQVRVERCYGNVNGMLATVPCPATFTAI